MSDPGYHTFAIEEIVHYNCASCGKWWSISDGPKLGEMPCPHCKATRHILDQKSFEELVDGIE